MVNSHDNGASCYFKAGTVNPVRKKTSTIENAIAHNRRTTQAANGSRLNIDPTRSNLNYCLAGDASPNAIAARVMAGMVEHKARKNAPHAVEVLISLPDNWEGDTRAVFVDAIPYLEGILGAGNLLSADVHLDEPNPHMHVLFMPLELCKKKGRLVWRSTLSGRGRELYDGFFSEVGVKHGLERPVNLSSNMRAALAVAVIDAMNCSGDGAINSRTWEAIKTTIKANPKPFAVQLGINLNAFADSKNPLGTFPVIENPLGSFEGKTKTLTLCKSFESTVLPADLKTGELKAERVFYETDKTTTETVSDRKVTQRVSASKQDSGMLETVRVRESENDPAYFNPETGEFFKPQQSNRLNRAAADNWVAGALSQQN